MVGLQDHAQLALLYSPGNRVAHTGLGPTASIISQDNLPQTHTQTSLIWAIPQLRLTFWVTLDYVKLMMVNETPSLPVPSSPALEISQEKQKVR